MRLPFSIIFLYFPHFHLHLLVINAIQVGPVEKCVVSEGQATISFGAAEHAFSAVQKYDGSVLEAWPK